MALGTRRLIAAKLKNALTNWLMTPETWDDLLEVLREFGRVPDDVFLGALGNFGPQRDESHAVVHAPDAVRRQVRSLLVAELGVAGDPKRFVNTVIAAAGSDAPVPGDRPLTPGTAYELLVSIGAPRKGSLLQGGDAEFPDSLLPDGDLWLRAVLTSGADSPAVVVPFTLPAVGDSFACACPPDRAHRAECERLPWARFALPLPAGEGVWHGTLIVYFQVVAVHAQELTITVGGASGGGHAVKTYGLTTSFSNLRGLSDRTASVLVSSDASHLTLNGISFLDSPVTMNLHAADEVIGDARDILYDTHFEAVPDGLYNRLDSRFGKSQQEFEEDLARLARVGRQIYVSVFKTVGTKMRRLIRQEARARNHPPRICLSEPHSVQSGTRPTIPWSLVYDLPIGMSGPYRVCPSVRDFGAQGRLPAVIPAHCPYSDHTDAQSGYPDTSVLCVFGFWGLSCVVEQPPGVAADAVLLVSAADLPKSLFFAASPGLDRKVTAAHLDTLVSLLDAGDTVVSPLPADAELAAALQGEDMDIVYLYCHCGYQRISSRTSPIAYLEVGGMRLDPYELHSWADELWPERHWPSRKPLVVLNGCHTAEMTSSTLATFVNSFVDVGGAAGMIGTEITVEQGFAASFMEAFLSRFARGDSVGSALRASRWEFLSRGNVLGLAYTPYCLSSLRIRAGHDPAPATASASTN